jgi:hypothetical protein
VTPLPLLVRLCRWNAAAAPTQTYGPLILAAILLLLVSQFSRLTTAVTDDAFECWFGSGLIRRRIPLARIEDASVVRHRWFYGWGIRLTPRGWLWNVSGLGIVELSLEKGRRFSVGSDEPERLAAALRQRLRA